MARYLATDWNESVQHMECSSTGFGTLFWMLEIDDFELEFILGWKSTSRKNQNLLEL